MQLGSKQSPASFRFHIYGYEKERKKKRKDERERKRSLMYSIFRIDFWVTEMKLHPAVGPLLTRTFGEQNSLQNGVEKSAQSVTVRFPPSQ